MIDTNSANAYLRTRVMTANPAELRLMLIEGAIRFASQAREGLARRDYEASFNGFGKAREIVLELMSGIAPDADPELVARVRGVYAFIYTELVEASFEKDVPRVGKVIELLEFERETWVLAIERLRAEIAGGGASATGGAAAGAVAGTVGAGAAGRVPLSVSA